MFSFVQLRKAYLNISAGSVEIWCVFSCTCVQLLYCWVWWKHLFTPFSVNSFFLFVYLTQQGCVDFFFFNPALLLWQNHMWMERNTHQDNDDSESEYDVVDNPEARNVHVPARPVNQDNEYAGRFLIYISALFFFCHLHLNLKPWCNLAVTEAYFRYSLTFFISPFLWRHKREKTSMHTLYSGP